MLKILYQSTHALHIVAHMRPDTISFSIEKALGAANTEGSKLSSGNDLSATLTPPSSNLARLCLLFLKIETAHGAMFKLPHLGVVTRLKDHDPCPIVP